MSWLNQPYNPNNPIIPEEFDLNKNPVISKEIKFFIKDNSGEWVDFTNRVDNKSFNSLISNVTFKYSTEKRGGIPSLESSVNDIELINKDYFFDKPAEGIYNIKNQPASFSQSYNKRESVWRYREVKFELLLYFNDNSVLSDTLGVFIIKDIYTTDSKIPKVKLKLESKTNLLKKADASVVKNGSDWYQNVTIPFLVKELLKTQFANEDGDLPNNFYIDPAPSLPIPSSVGDGLAYSTLGVPPQTERGENPGKKYIRAMDIWIWNTGTVSSSSDNAYKLTASTSWAPVPNSELVQNGGFENWTSGSPDNWIVTGDNPTQDTTRQRTGNSCLRFPNNSTSVFYLKQDVSLNSSTRYAINFSIRPYITGTAGTRTITVKIYNGSTTLVNISRNFMDGLGDMDWDTYGTVFYTDSDSGTFTIEISKNAVASGDDEIYLDDVKLIKLGELRPEVGDSIVIKGSSNGNDGVYTIKSIDGTEITLSDPLRGKAESGMSYTITNLYFIYNEIELWKLNPHRVTYSLVEVINLDRYHTGKKQVDINGYQKDMACNVIPMSLKVVNNQIYIIEGYTVDDDEWGIKYYRGGLSKLICYDGSDYLRVGNGVDSYSTYYNLINGEIGPDNLTGNFRNSENLFVTHTQGINRVASTEIFTYIYEYRDTISTDVPSTPPITPAGRAEDGKHPNIFTKGYWFLDGEDATDGCSQVFDWNQDTKITFAKNWGNLGCIVTVYSSFSPTSSPGSSSLYNVRIRKFDIETGQDNYLDIPRPMTTYDYAGHGIFIKYSDVTDECLVSVIWGECTESPGVKYFADYLYIVDSSLNYYKCFGDYSSPSKMTFIDGMIIKDIDSNTRGAVVVRLDRTNTETPYRLDYMQLSKLGTYSISLKMRSPTPLNKITRLKPNSINSNDIDVVIFHKHQNSLIKFDGNSLNFSLLANGNEIAPGDGDVSTPLIVDEYTRSNNPIVYGISWSGGDPYLNHEVLVPNKGLMWKLDSYVTPIVELADFDGLSVEEAIGRLAQVCNHIAFFNKEGYFYFVERSISEVPDYIIRHEEDNSIIVGDIKKYRGYDEIYNHFTMIPYRTKISETELEITLVKRDESEPEQDITQAIECNSLSNRKRTVRLVCVEGGVVSDKITLFKWLISVEQFEIKILEEISGSKREFLVSTVYGGDNYDSGINAGDFIVLVNSDEEKIIREIAGGRGIGNLKQASSGSNNVKVYDTNYYNVGDKINIHFNTVGGWRRQAATIIRIVDDYLYLNEDVEYTASDGDVLAPINPNDRIISIYNTVTGTIEKGSNAIIVRNSAKSSDDSYYSWSNDQLTFVTADGSSTEVKVNNTKYIAPGNYIHIDNTTTSPTKVVSVDHSKNVIILETPRLVSKGNKINVYWSPGTTSGGGTLSFSEIPGSDFQLKVSNDEVYFKPGDVIVLSNDGLILKQDSSYRRLALSLTSQNKYGKLDFPTIKNRFMHPRIAEILLNNLLDFYKFPRYQLELSIFLLPYIDFIRFDRLASLRIISKTLFPRDKNFSRDFFIRSFSVDYKNNKISMKLIDSEFY